MVGNRGSTDITISSPPPCCPLDLDSPDVKRILSANANSHLQVFEKRKLYRGNKRDPDSGQKIQGDDVIGDILLAGMMLLPFAIDPFGRLGPLARTFLYGTSPLKPITFPASRPNASEMHQRITSFPSPNGILPHADHTWSTHRTRSFFAPLAGHQRGSSYSQRHSLLVTGTNRLLPFSAHRGVEWSQTGVPG